MPKVITDDDLRKMAQRGKLPKGISLWKERKATERDDTNKPDDTMKALADAAMKAVEETGKALNVNAAMVQVVISKLAEIKDRPMIVNVPERKYFDWMEADIEVTERDANHNIKKIRFMKKVVK